MTTPTFVGTIEELRRLKAVFAEMKLSMTTGKAMARNDVEKSMATSLINIAEKMEKALQDLSTDVSTLAINNSKEDLTDIMKALSK